MKPILSFVLAFISNKSSFIQSLSSLDFRLKVNKSCIQLFEIEMSLARKQLCKDRRNLQMFFYFNDIG